MQNMKCEGKDMKFWYNEYLWPLIVPFRLPIHFQAWSRYIPAQNNRQLSL